MTRTTVVVLALATLPIEAQVKTRAEEIEAARARKAAELKPEETSGLEKALVEIKDKKIIERLTAGVAGFRFLFGGLASGSGFAVGPEYLRRDLAGGKVVFRSSARVSFKAYQKYDMELELPSLAGGRFFADLLATHRNYPRVNYYGPGPDSAKT
ncbi:MAG: hypothetical protein ACRD96_15920, partial [Bryobacteraceae bacterium]